jgi:hypothetical protein
VVAIRVLNQNNPGSTGQLVDLDSFRVEQCRDRKIGFTDRPGRPPKQATALALSAVGQFGAVPSRPLVPLGFPRGSPFFREQAACLPTGFLDGIWKGKTFDNSFLRWYFVPTKSN